MRKRRLSTIFFKNGRWDIFLILGIIDKFKVKLRKIRIV